MNTRRKQQQRRHEYLWGNPRRQIKDLVIEACEIEGFRGTKSTFQQYNRKWRTYRVQQVFHISYGVAIGNANSLIRLVNED